MKLNIQKVNIQRIHGDKFNLNIQMDETLWYKFTQHSDLKEELLATGEAELIEVRNAKI